MTMETYLRLHSCMTLRYLQDNCRAFCRVCKCSQKKDGPAEHGLWREHRRSVFQEHDSWVNSLQFLSTCIGFTCQKNSFFTLICTLQSKCYTNFSSCREDYTFHGTVLEKATISKDQSCWSFDIFFYSCFANLWWSSTCPSVYSFATPHLW